MIFVYVITLCVGAGTSILTPIPNGLDPYIFLSEEGKDAVYERRNGRKGVYFPPELAFFVVINSVKVLYPICTLNWRVKDCVSRQGKGKSRRNESTVIKIKLWLFWYCTSIFHR